MPETTDAWPLRSLLLGVMGALVALAVQQLVAVAPGGPPAGNVQLALATLLAVSGVAFGFVIERTRLHWSAAFAAAAGTVIAAVVYWNGGWGYSDTWRLVCAALTVAIAAPLFQAWRDARAPGAGRFAMAYPAVHDHAWTNVLLFLAALLFVGIVWLLMFLLSALFNLIGIDALEKLLRNDQFGAVLVGGAFGGAVGLLRDRSAVISTLQRVVMTILSVLAPVLAAGLLLFLLALPFTGLAPLWQATKSTTPILLSCIIGALLLINAVIGDRPVDVSRLALLRWSAVVLALAMLPLSAIAAVSTGLRINQYGLTPDRLWALVFIAFAKAYGLGYLLALLRARSGWPVRVRIANLRLAVGLCGVALLLSTPLVNFGAISTRDQLARLANGRTPADKFDWTALRFDFGAPGEAAVKRLVTEGKTPEIRAAAAVAAKADRNARYDVQRQQVAAIGIEERLVIKPQTVPLPASLRQSVSDYAGCTKTARCVLFYEPGATRAVLVGRLWAGAERVEARLLREYAGAWNETTGFQSEPVAEIDKRNAQQAAALAAGQVEIRTVERRQVFVGGEPVGEPFE
ncbi:DUF4153 domain-containing protein [Polymorphobacter arshaanensis]|uniref:DUF4153 domain-containing protein n=1 Tax=Glacieibacterium arshaanense TaxID=2511025 RepID=A0A4Y9EMK2_9SPHN|nr:DUF4153 domain-containing protein [Polymorphobacter arshaanensis]TFU03053.1 DUF4153 domain-containing protein [Polymorphobacter arshaanensis]